jgi:hypothetical protein
MSYGTSQWTGVVPGWRRASVKLHAWYESRVTSEVVGSREVVSYIQSERFLSLLRGLPHLVLEKWKDLSAEDLYELGLVAPDVVNIDLGKSHRYVALQPFDMPLRIGGNANMLIHVLRPNLDAGLIEFFRQTQCLRHRQRSPHCYATDRRHSLSPRLRTGRRTRAPASIAACPAPAASEGVDDLDELSPAAG